MTRTKLISTLLFLSLSLTSCVTVPPRVDQVQRLLHHPQFPAARAAAPEWSREALTVINDLQLEIATLEANR
jgi:hypothetical protein